MSGGRSVKFKEPVSKKAWQDSLSSSSKALGFLLTTGMLSDITFAVGPEGKQFRVHRLILATRSPVFEELLVSDPRYSSCDDVVPIRDDSTSAFQWLMQHIYLDRSDIDSVGAALKILGLSEKYMVQSSLDCCMNYLKVSVKRSNVLSVYSYLITTYSDNEALLSICRKIFQENSEAVLTGTGFHKVPPKALSALLQEPLRVTSEVVVFNALMSWGAAQLKFKGLAQNCTNLRREVEPFLCEVRFFTMSSDEFVQTVLVTDLLTAEETVSVLKHIAQPHNANLSLSPDASRKICRNKEPRLNLNLLDPPFTVTCDDVKRSWLKQSTYEFHLTSSDHILLIGFSFQTQDNTSLKVEVRYSGDSSTSSPASSSSLLGSAEAVQNLAMFLKPIPLEESVDYFIKVFSLTSDPLSLYGAEHNASTYTRSGISLTLAPGVFVYSVMFA